MAIEQTLVTAAPLGKGKLGNVWVKGGVKSYFTKPKELVNLLEPLVLALHWGGDYRQLVEALPHFADDLDLTEFLNVMSTIDYNNEYLDMSLHKIPEKYMPCLFIPQDGTALVVLEKRGMSLLVIDGDTGSEMTIESKRVPGVVYVFSPFDTDKAVVKKHIESFMQSFIRFRPLVSQIFVLTLMYNILMAAVPIYTMLIYDKVIPSESMSMAASFLAGILIFVAGAQMLAVARIKIVAYIGARLDKTIGEAIIQHLLYLPPSYTEGNTVGAQITRIKSFDNIRDFFTSNIAIMACEFPFVVVFLGVLFFVGGWLGFVPVVLGLLFYAIYHVANPMVDRFVKIQSAHLMLKQSFLLESFFRMRDIKETGHSDVWENKFHEMLIRLTHNSFENTFYNATLGTVSELFMMLAALVMLVLGAYLSMHDSLSLGALILTMMLTWKVLNPLKSFFSSLPKVEQIFNSIVQVNKLFGIQSERTTEKATVPADIEKSKIEFNRVTFRYRQDLAPAILGISFVVQPGELICVAGKNSSGKSTLLRLILGLYRPQAGNILINDMNVQQFDPIELRHTIAYMPQNIQLFYGTIKQNLLFGNMVSTDAEIQEAATLAGVHEDIMGLPKQYNTRLGDEKSSEFSNTFLQKIVLARTYLKHSSIMLFDEPSNGFDLETEKNFIEAINKLRKNSTIVWVTHRPSHLKIADKILYMEGGEVALFGEAAKVLERLPRSSI